MYQPVFSCQLFIIFRLPSVKASRFKCNVEGIADGEPKGVGQKVKVDE